MSLDASTVAFRCISRGSLRRRVACPAVARCGILARLGAGAAVGSLAPHLLRRAP